MGKCGFVSVNEKGNEDGTEYLDGNGDRLVNNTKMHKTSAPSISTRHSALGTQHQYQHAAHSTQHQEREEKKEEDEEEAECHLSSDRILCAHSESDSDSSRRTVGVRPFFSDVVSV